jgi:hypothetical protein
MRGCRLLAALLVVIPPATDGQGRPGTEPRSLLLRVYEKQLDANAKAKCKQAAAAAVSVYSDLTVVDDGAVLYRVAVGCDGHILKTPPHGWPGSGNPEEIYRSRLSPARLADLKTFLDTQKVKDILDFPNAAPIFDDYSIEIARQNKPQLITVIAFMPEHRELQDRPALTQLICKAKDIAREASKSGEVPEWCKAAFKET